MNKTLFFLLVPCLIAFCAAQIYSGYPGYGAGGYGAGGYGYGGYGYGGYGNGGRYGASQYGRNNNGLYLGGCKYIYRFYFVLFVNKLFCKL